MALKYADRVAESTITTGTGDISLAGAIDTDHASFASQFADGDTMPVTVFGGGKWMTFVGRYNSGPNSVTRVTFRRSSTGSNLALSGTMTVLCGWLADDAGAVSAANLLNNADFRINQRGYASAAALAAGGFGHDRWKGGAAGGTYSFTQSVGPTTITIAAAKSLVQVIEPLSVDGGTYVLSWAGTAQARVALNGSTPAGGYANSPIVISGQTAGTAMAVEFGPGTLGMPKLEIGLSPTPFQMKPISVENGDCRRFYRRLGYGVRGNAESTTTIIFGYFHDLPMRSIPTVTQIGSSISVRRSASASNLSISVSLVDADCTAKGGRLYYNLTAGALTAGELLQIQQDDYVELSADL